MLPIEIACARCRKVGLGWIEQPDGSAYCRDCHWYTVTLHNALALTPEQQRELVKALSKDEVHEWILDKRSDALA